MTPATPAPLSDTVQADALRQAGACARAWASEAAERVRRAAGQPLPVQHKGAGDWASALDAEVEAFLREAIAQTFPDHAFLGEESGGAGALQTAAHLWVVDPIDGSMNFLRGYPQYSVSVALLQHGEPVVGCVVDPTRGEVFWAVRGQGAWCNDKPLRVASTTELSHALAATVFPKPRSVYMDRYTPQLMAVLNGAAGLRRSGSMALELAYLAAGRIDAFWQWGMGPWDAAAGVLLIREAGGAVHSLDGAHWLHAGGSAAAAPGVSDAWLELLGSASR